MKIKTLTLDGFKSFADKTVIEFQPGLTGIVGPNGSGKSNITEAIRWVIGEQSAKNLRGDKMPDVIFAGSEIRAGLNRAEVELVLDNSDKYLDYPHEQINIKRRIFKDGESEFYLNNKKIRLKDIVELFMDTGLGRESFSIISQGRVEAIFNSKPEERRKLIEEVAGVLKYKKEKKKAQSELDSTTDHLNRVADIVFELEKQIEPLKEQASKAKDYVDQKAQYDELNQTRLGIEILANNQEKVELEEKLRQVNKVITEKASLLTKQDKEIKSLRTQQKEIEVQLDDSQKELTFLSRQEEKIKGKQDVSAKVENFQNQRIDELENQVKQNTENLKRTQENVKLLEKQKQELNKKKAELSVNIHELEILVSNSSEDTVADLEFKLKNLAQQLELLERENEFLSTNIATKVNELDDKNNELSQYNNQIKENQAKIKKIDKKIANINDSAANLKTKLNSIQNLLNKKTLKLQNNEIKEAQAKEIYQKANTRLETLKNIAQSYSNYYQGTREILKANLEGVVGPVAEKIDVPKEFNKAIETALGSQIQNVITINDKAAQIAIKYLSNNRLGRVTFLPRNTVTPRYIDEKIKALISKDSGFVGIASELINFDSADQVIVKYLLGSTIVAKNLEDATRIAKITKFKNRVVTIDGDVVNSGGSLTGGKTKGKREGVFEQKQQIAELSQNIEVMNEKLVIFQNNNQQLKIKINELEEEYQRLNSEITEFAKEKNELEAKRNIIELTLEHLNENVKNNMDSKANAELEELRRKLDVGQNKHRELQQEYEISYKIFNQHKQSIDSEKNNLQQNQLKLSEQKQKLAVLDEKLRVNILQVADYKYQIDNLKDLIAKQKQKISDIQVEIKQSSEESSDFELKQANLVEKIASLKKTIAELQNKRNNIHAEINKIESKNKVDEALNMNALDEQRKISVKISQLETMLKRSLKDLSDLYHKSFDEIKDNLDTSKLNEINRKLHLLKLGIDELGNVNIGAIDEFQRVNERYEFLAKQQSDLIDAKKQLEDSMVEMDTEVKKRFETTFKKVAEAFKQTFPVMFSGGKAELTLTDPNNLLESGIEIMAQPPGKKFQRLSLLSGGERALTAITLLFAILKVKPVPFVVLDEAEAALDEANVTRYAQYLKKFDEKTQFIVITHRKGTMGYVDVLYGVTMQESGISQVVSVTLDDI